MRHDLQHCKLRANVLKPGTYPNLQVFKKTKVKRGRWLDKEQNRQLAPEKIDGTKSTHDVSDDAKDVDTSKSKINMVVLLQARLTSSNLALVPGLGQRKGSYEPTDERSSSRF